MLAVLLLIWRFEAVRLELHRHRKENGMLNRAGTIRKQ
jgi:hypothetical protein